MDCILPLQYQQHNIIGLKKINTALIKPESYCLIRTKEDEIFFRKIKIKNRKAIFTYDEADDTTIKSELFVSSIKNIYEIVAAIRL